jgi:L-seryl-tRNA(Ser) seleniumtransferase
MQNFVRQLSAAGIDARPVASQAAVGGGGAPGVALPSAAVSLPAELAEPLRHGPAVRDGRHPAVVGRLADGRLLLDLFALDPADDPTLTAAVRTAAVRTAAPSDLPGARGLCR